MILTLNCDKSPTQVTWTKADYLLAASKDIGLNCVELYKTTSNPEYVLNIEPFDKFIRGSKWTGIYEIDVTFDRGQMNLSNWIASDMVFVANSNLPDRMKAYQGPKQILFQACDPLIHRRIPSIKPQYDFVFAGSCGLQVYEERERCMDLLRKEGFTFFGHGKEHPIKKYVEKMNEGRIQFIRSAGKQGVAKSQVEQRFFECLAMGPVLKDYHPDLEKLGLIEGEDLFWYCDDAEMISKMHYLINNPKFASRMADKGREKALTYHSYSHRLVTIINLIKEYENQKSTSRTT